ncbi:MAG: hydrogenase maturation nickel metallochaperone HypA [Anaerolineae bacterium]|nr:hydrogenase maturation nickel metallochaperone HypA [Anaerolineae bacterium]
MEERLERMRAIVAQAMAECKTMNSERPCKGMDIHLIVYGGIDEAEARVLFESASRGTPAEGAKLVIELVGTRYICWNCCGLRFESSDGVCPNCGEAAIKVPDEIAFALRSVAMV